jgi:outer membrane protein assembly factor BamB
MQGNWARFLSVSLFATAVIVAAAIAWMLQAEALAQRTPRGKTPAVARPAADQLALAEAERGNWSRWRGPNGDGISLEQGLLTEWPEKGPPLAWKSSGLGSGFASVAIVDGKLFTMGSKDGEALLICRNAEDGKPVWETTIANGEGPNCTPTVDGELVFCITAAGDLACCETKTGKLVWTKDFQKEFKARKPVWSFSESPLVDGDLVIATPGTRDAVMVAFDKRTGDIVWKAKMPADPGKGHGGAGYASPVIGNCGGVKQYITLMGHGVIGVDAKSGELLWGYSRVANGTASIPTPIVQGDYVFCSSGYGDGGTALLKISKKGRSLAAEEVWWKNADELQNHHGGMIAIGDHVYMGHGHDRGLPVCVEFKTGKAAWGPARGAGANSAAIAYADGHLYFRYQDATMALIEANPREYKLKGSFKLATNNGASWPHPVIAGGRLYLRDQNDLLCYDVAKR